MKIIFVRHTLLNRGGDKMILAHANHLADSGHEVIIETSRVDTIFAISSKVNLSRIGERSKFGTLWRSFTTRYIDTDLLIADIIPLACLLFFRNQGKVIYFAQDYDESYYSNIFQKLFVRSLYLLGLTFFRIRSIAVSRPLGDLLCSRFGADVTVVENGVDTTIFYADPDHELVAAKEGRKALLLLSRTDHRKGFDIAVQTMERLQSKLTIPYEIWTVGEPAQGLFLGLIHRDFGYVGEAELRRIMSSADLFLYPTRHEGLPLMPLEAMASGCPVIVSSASHAIAQHGINSIVLSQEDPQRYADELCILLSDQELCSRLIAGGLQTATFHTLKDAQQQFDNILSGWIVAG